MRNSRHSFNIRELIRFLEQNDWDLLDKGQNTLLFKYEGMTLEIPDSTEYNWSRSVIDSNLRFLSSLYEIDLESLVEKIIITNWYKYSIRFPESYLHIPSASDVVFNYQVLLASVASSSVKPRPFVARFNKEATDFVRKCRFAGTKKGSLIFVFQTPVKEKLPLKNLAYENNHIENKVFERFYSGFESINNAEKNKDFYTLEEQHIKGFDARALSIIASFGESFSENLEFNLSQPNQISKLKNQYNSYRYQFSNETYSQVKLICEQMTKRFEEEIEEEVQGYVIALKSDAKHKSIEFEGVVTVVYNETYTNKERKVRLVLDIESYDLALQAHERALKVSFVCRLEKKGIFTYANNLREFRIIED